MNDSPSAEPGRKAVDLALPLRLFCGIAFASIVILTIAQVFFRFALDSPLIWSEELVKLLLVWVVFVGSAVLCWDGRHLNVDVLLLKLPAGLRQFVRAINLFIALGFLGILTYTSVEVVKLNMYSELGALEIPQAWVRVPATIGGGLMILFILLRRFYRLPVEGGGRDDPV